MKVITLAMLALAALAAGVSAAAIPKERNLRGSMKMHHLEAHKASHMAHDVMPAMPAMETRSSNGKPKQKVKKSKAGKKSSMEAKPTGARLPPPPPLPMKDGKVDIAAFMKEIEVGVPPPGGMQQPGAGNAPPLSNSGASFDKRSAMVPKPVAKSGGVAMEAHDSLDSYFQALKKANEVSPPAYNQEAQAEAAMADNNNNLQHAVSMESDHVFSKGTAFEARLHNQKSTKGKKGKKAL